MDVFEKATKAVKEVGGNVIDSAKSIGNSIYSTSKEQRELAGMKVQKSQRWICKNWKEICRVHEHIGRK